MENVAHAHVLAARSLAFGAAHAGGAYLVTGHAPANVFDFVEPDLRAAGVRRDPRTMAWFEAFVAGR